ncbi:MAG: cell division protein FtsQ/DivIB [Carbonactinosporaceae bacterium]
MSRAPQARRPTKGRPRGRAATPSRAPSRAPSSVSQTSQGRFAARDRARRWHGVRPFLIAGVVLFSAGGLAWLALLSGILAVRHVQVTGTERLSSQEVHRAARVPFGEPLMIMDATALASRVARLREVAYVEVVRRWPDSVEIVVHERRVAAVVPRDGGGFLLVDRVGVVFGRVAVPRGAPVIRAEPAQSGRGSRRAAVEVLRALPFPVADRVEAVAVDSPYHVVLRLKGGARVVWGGPDESARKAEVLSALMGREADIYDVSVPAAPTVRR